MRVFTKKILFVIPVTIYFSCLNHAHAKTLGTSNFNESWLDAVISIETMVEDESKPVGTGFLVRDKPNKRMILFTAAHVVLIKRFPEKSLKYLKKNLRYRRLDVGEEATTVADKKLKSAGAGSWFFSKEHDLAARIFGWYQSGEGPKGIPLNRLIEHDQLEIGAPLIILGFPVGLRTTDHKYPIARSGMVARVDSDNILIESFLFPGNSGGPVIYVPVMKFNQAGPINIDYPFVDSERLVGVVTSYLPYQEIAISPQTDRARVIFEENSGLATIVGTDSIKELLEKIPTDR